MLNSRKKNRALHDKKINILTLVLSENIFLNEPKNHTPPLFKLNGRSPKKHWKKKREQVFPLSNSNFTVKVSYSVIVIWDMVYILNITLYILSFMLLSNNLWKRPSLHTLSKAFSKSIIAQYNFFFLTLRFEIV